MNRFMGMMPSSEVSKEKVFKDESGLNITVQAGAKGWTIIYADGGTEYKDVEATTDENFSEAYEHLTEKFDNLTSVKDEHTEC